LDAESNTISIKLIDFHYVEEGSMDPYLEGVENLLGILNKLKNV